MPLRVTAEVCPSCRPGNWEAQKCRSTCGVTTSGQSGRYTLGARERPRAGSHGDQDLRGLRPGSGRPCPGCRHGLLSRTKCACASIACGVRRPLRHRQPRSRVASATRVAGSTGGIRFLSTPLDDLFECSNTSRSCYRLGAKRGSHSAKSRQESGGVWTVICPGKQHFANLLDSSRPARGLLHTEEVIGSIPASSSGLAGQLRSCPSRVRRRRLAIWAQGWRPGCRAYRRWGRERDSSVDLLCRSGRCRTLL
jgi:hypothetical protein